MYKTTKRPPGGQKPGVRAPRAIVMVGGYQIAKFEDFTVEQNGFSAADTFTLRLPFFVVDDVGNKVLDPAGNPVQAIDPNVTSLLVNQDLVLVQLYVGYPKNPNNFSASDLTQVMDGTMDTARWQFGLMGETVTITGRNKVGDLIDTKVVQKFPNTPGSTIAQRFADEHGLQAEITPSPQFAGTLSKNEVSIISPKMSQWDLLLFMAKRDNYVCRVKGDTLYYGPFADVVIEDSVGTDPLLLTYGYNIEDLDLERSPQAARDIIVTVASYDRNTKLRITETASSNTEQASKIKGQLGQRGKYYITIFKAGLTRQQCQDLAQKTLKSYSGTQMLGNLTTDGNVGAAVDRKITLADVGAGIVQDYFINKVVHRMSLRDGYRLDLGFSKRTDYTDTLNDSSPDGTSGNAASNSGSANSIVAAARAQNGRVFGPNGCGRGVNAALLAAGIDVTTLGVANVAAAPDYEGLGTTITNESDLQPGDLVLTELGKDQARGGVLDAGHVGIYDGNGQFWSVATHSQPTAYSWVLTPIFGGFVQGQRL